MYAFHFQPAQALFSSCVGTASCGGRSGGQGGIQGSTLRYLYPPPARGIEVASCDGDESVRIVGIIALAPFVVILTDRLKLAFTVGIVGIIAVAPFVVISRVEGSFSV